MADRNPTLGSLTHNEAQRTRARINARYAARGLALRCIAREEGLYKDTVHVLFSQYFSVALVRSRNVK